MKANKETGWKSELHGADEFQFEAEDGRAIFNNGVYKWVYIGEDDHYSCTSCFTNAISSYPKNGVHADFNRKIGIWDLIHYDKDDARKCVRYCDKCLLALNLKGITKERMGLAKTLGELRDD